MQHRRRISNPLEIRAGEALPPLEQLLDAARQEALELEQSRRRRRPLPKINLKTPEVLFIGEGARYDKIFGPAIEGRGFPSVKAESLEAARKAVEEHLPDLVIIDSRVPNTKELQVLREFHARAPHLPFIRFAPATSAELVAEAFRLGASDVLIEPVTPERLLQSIEGVLKKLTVVAEEQEYQQYLERALSDRTGILIGYMEALKDRSNRLGRAFRDVVDRLGRAAQWRDDETGNHITRIGLFSQQVARKMGLSKEDVELLGTAAPLHDIGKIGVPDGILLKPGKLTELEFAYMRAHTQIGAEILTGSDDPLLRASEAIALSHHEWYNGNGYPYQIRKSDIPLFAKIVAVVDVYDAMIHERSYKKAVPLDQTIEIMGRRRGVHFDPEVFDAFLETVEDLVRIETRLESTSSDATRYDVQFGLHKMTRHLEKSFRAEVKRTAQNSDSSQQKPE